MEEFSVLQWWDAKNWYCGEYFQFVDEMEYLCSEYSSFSSFLVVPMWTSGHRRDRIRNKYIRKKSWGSTNCGKDIESHLKWFG